MNFKVRGIKTILRRWRERKGGGFEIERRSGGMVGEDISGTVFPHGGGGYGVWVLAAWKKYLQFCQNEMFDVVSKFHLEKMRMLFVLLLWLSLFQFITCACIYYEM